MISSNYLPNIGGNNQRSGYYLWAVDAVGHSFAVGIAGTGITIHTDSNFLNGNGVPFTPFDTTNGFHNYQLVIDGGLGSLYIDGNLIASTALGGAAVPGLANAALFGDASGLGNSETELRLFRFDTLASAPVPEPSSLGVFLGLTGCASLLGRWRRAARRR